MRLEELEDGTSDIECIGALALVDGFGAAPDANLERRDAGLISGPGSATQVGRGCTPPHRTCGFSEFLSTAVNLLTMKARRYVDIRGVV